MIEMKACERGPKKRKGKGGGRQGGAADSLPKAWPAWVRKWVRKFEAAEHGTARDYLTEFDIDHAPEWVMKMSAELFRVAAPSIRWDFENASGPHFLGGVVGHIESVLNSEHGLPVALEKMDAFRRQLDRKIRGTLTKQQFALWRKQQQKSRDAIEALRSDAKRLLSDFEAVAGRKLQLVEECVAAASKQPPEEKMEFLDAYVRTLKQKIFAEDGYFFHEKSSHEKLRASSICFLMVSNWRVVNDFKNFGEFRRWLSKKFGPQNIGSCDRLKKLCKRYGYNPGGSAGRPAGQAVKPDEMPECLTAYILTSDVLKSRPRTKN